MQLQLMLTAENVRQSLGNKDTQALVVEKLGQLVSRKNKIRFAAVYFKNGDPFAQDPFDPKWSLLSKDDQKPFYADFGLLASPIMQNFPAMQIGAGGRRNKAAARIGGGAIHCDPDRE